MNRFAIVFTSRLLTPFSRARVQACTRLPKTKVSTKIPLDKTHHISPHELRHSTTMYFSTILCYISYIYIYISLMYNFWEKISSVISRGIFNLLHKHTFDRNAFKIDNEGVWKSLVSVRRSENNLAAKQRNGYLQKPF